jgi:hypothetical protein
MKFFFEKLTGVLHGFTQSLCKLVQKKISLWIFRNHGHPILKWLIWFSHMSKHIIMVFRHIWIQNGFLKYILKWLIWFSHMSKHIIITFQHIWIQNGFLKYILKWLIWFSHMSKHIIMVFRHIWIQNGFLRWDNQSIYSTNKQLHQYIHS